jgi:hypothetical protein
MATLTPPLDITRKSINQLTTKGTLMIRNLSIRFVALTISLLLGFLPVQAAERPFAFDGSGTAAFIADTAGNVTAANVTASGTATYLGLWTAVGTVHFAPDPNHAGRLLSSAVLAFTAANGDNLQVKFNGNLDPAAGFDTGVIQFVGGTGRFAGATGFGDFVVQINPLTGAFKTTAIAKINF